MIKLVRVLCVVSLLLAIVSCQNRTGFISLEPNQHITLVGNNLGARMMIDGFFETELHSRYPSHQLYIRNQCDAGNTPGFQPHSGRVKPWAYPGAEKHHAPRARDSNSQGTLATPDEWLTNHKSDIILAFFGFNEASDGENGLDNFKADLTDYLNHVRSQQYNGVSPPEVILISPIALEDVSDSIPIPGIPEKNQIIQKYVNAMAEVATTLLVPFVDLYTTSNQWYQSNSQYLTIDGLQLNTQGNEILGKYLADQIFGGSDQVDINTKNEIRNAVNEKNWMWHNDYKIPNGVHVFGRRYDPFGPDNYPYELKKIREMTAIRDQAIWKTAQGEPFDVSAADAQTHSLPAVTSNMDTTHLPELSYQYGEDALSTFRMAPGYQIELFADERQFPNLANPVQLSFDNQGRLWVATMPTYPHYRPGDPKPDDKLLILEDTDQDGKADREIVFADGLHLPTGFELTPQGVYVAQGTHLMLLQDRDGDDRYDHKQVVMSGFDDHDTHHVISAFCSDPVGAIYMAEGVFLHTNVETVYGPIRATNGGFYRFSPSRLHLERTAQVPIPNPWGIAFDDFGQPFFAETSGPDVRWMTPSSLLPIYGVSHYKAPSLIEPDHKVRPTSGLEFISSRHFPDQVQGDMLINNTIGFLGTKQHRMIDEATGFTTKHRQDLLRSNDPNFRPVDMEFAPDGSLYLVDWHNKLIGHMQHNARDPLRDHEHGRIYRITYPSRPLVKPADIHQAPIEVLLANLTLPEYRTRYRTRRELRGRNAQEVLPQLQSWVKNLDKQDKNHDRHLMEALWVTAGFNQMDMELLRSVLRSKDFRVRAAGVKIARQFEHLIPEAGEMMKGAALDEHARVRLEAVVGSTWLESEISQKTIEFARRKPVEEWVENVYLTAEAHVRGKAMREVKDEEVVSHLTGSALASFKSGMEIYGREGHCGTCHQLDGAGLSASQYPPLAGTPWVTGSQERLIKLAIKGLYGPIEVLGRKYPGNVPMTPFGGLLNDQELADVLTYIRNSFGNKAEPITAQQVSEVRSSIESKEGFYSPEELLTEHPLESIQ